MVLGQPGGPEEYHTDPPLGGGSLVQLALAPMSLLSGVENNQPFVLSVKRSFLALLGLQSLRHPAGTGHKRRGCWERVSASLEGGSEEGWGWAGDIGALDPSNGNAMVGDEGTWSGLGTECKLAPPPPTRWEVCGIPRALLAAQRTKERKENKWLMDRDHSHSGRGSPSVYKYLSK